MLRARDANEEKITYVLAGVKQLTHCLRRLINGCRSLFNDSTNLYLRTLLHVICHMQVDLSRKSRTALHSFPGYIHERFMKKSKGPNNYLSSEHSLLWYIK